jgi:hypothetical protein
VGGFYILFFTNCFWTWPVILKQVEKDKEAGESEKTAGCKTACEQENEAVGFEEDKEELIDSETLV